MIILIEKINVVFRGAFGAFRAQTTGETMKTQDQINFEESLEELNSPFKKLFTKDLEEDLFAEYLKTKRYPDPGLYTRKFYTDEEIQEGYTKDSERFPSYESGAVPNNLTAGTNLRITKEGDVVPDFESKLSSYIRECSELAVKGELDQKYYSHTLSETPTIEYLNTINELRSEVKTVPREDIKTHAEKILHIISGFQDPIFRNNLVKFLSDEKIPIWHDTPNTGEIRSKELLFSTYFRPVKNPSLQTLTTPEQPKPAKEAEVNPYPHIFVNGIGYAIFKRLHAAYYPKKKTWQANYSFLFISLRNDGFIICSGVEFINFIAEKFQVTIGKIDSRQEGKNPKTTAYGLIKENITGKSTE